MTTARPRPGEVRLTNLDRVLWPETGFTKGDMLEYYRAVGGALLPHVSGRPVTLGRFPTGVHEKGWYQTNCRAPDWMRTAEVPGRSGALFRMCLVGDLASLEWAVNQGTVELHPLLASAERLERPLVLVFDLDPGPPAGLPECSKIALELRELLAGDGLAAWPKTSGSLGLHLYVPLDVAATFGATRRYARRLAEELLARRPDAVTVAFPHAERVGRVLVDWRQNEPLRSMVAPYSLRATPWPMVSTPLAWSEVESVAGGADPRALLFGPAEVIERLRALGDLFQPVLSRAYRLPG